MEREAITKTLEKYLTKKAVFALALITEELYCLQTPAEQHADELVEAIEKTAADRAYAAGLGVSEWEAFLNAHERAVLAKVRTLPPMRTTAEGQIDMPPLRPINRKADEMNNVDLDITRKISISIKLIKTVDQGQIPPRARRVEFVEDTIKSITESKWSAEPTMILAVDMLKSALEALQGEDIERAKYFVGMIDFME